jgi:integrase
MHEPFRVPARFPQCASWMTVSLDVCSWRHARFHRTIQCEDRRSTLRLVSLPAPGCDLARSCASTENDVDLERAVLAIRQTKFRKDRLVPVHPTTRDMLRAYVKVRDAADRRSPSSAFFLSCRGGRLSASGLGTAFQEACAIAGFDRGLPRGLRPGDLRHRFAVTRLVTWHREGVDVQARLPVLATYLGHVRYSDTAYYVTGTPELLGLAAARAFGPERGVQ